jgi:hypothetical protein
VHVTFARFCWAAPPALPAGGFASLLPSKETAPAAQAVKKFLFRNFYNAPQAWKADINPLPLLINPFNLTIKTSAHRRTGGQEVLFRKYL